MIIDTLIYLIKKDPTYKRHFLKAIVWRLLGSLDTVVLGLIVTGKLDIGLKIGGLELFTKILLYFIHERIWQKITFGQNDFVIRQQNKPLSKNNLFKQYFAIEKSHREKQNAHPAFTIWLTGLSGSGKSTIASKLDQWFFDQKIKSYIIDGDNTRMGINNDLNFTREGRKENIRRVAEMAKLFNEAGIIVISSFISPFEEDRKNAAQIIGVTNFSEIYISSSLETCIQRDTKGLYKKAMEGKIKDFTGINSPYEIPQKPELILQTDNKSLPEVCEELITWLENNKLFYKKMEGVKIGKILR